MYKPVTFIRQVRFGINHASCWKWSGGIRRAVQFV